METEERWLKRPQSTIGQRNVDKELQRIKRLAVVSVLNKSFQDTAPPLRPSSSLLPSMSPSTSLTTSGTTQDFPSKPRSQSISHSFSSSSNSMKRPSNISLQSDYKQPEPNEDQKSEKEIDYTRLVTSSPIDSEKETLENRVLELQALYDASVKELHTVSTRSSVQMELVLMQDKLIHQMTDQLEDLTGASENTLSVEDTGAVMKAKQELEALNKELDELRPLKTEYYNMLERLTESDRKLEELEQIARVIQKENAAQTLYIDTKVQTLLNKLLQKNEIIHKLEQQQQQQQQQQSIAPTPEMISKSSDLKSLNDSSSVIWENSGEDDSNVGQSARSSYISNESNLQHRKSYIARWKGSALPPASPPPSLPLPPIPSVSSRSRPKSTLSEISKGSSIASYSKHFSMDAVGVNSHRRPSIQSELDAEIAEAAYYKEFTDQLQERLSMSKEIDDLRVWEPSDYDSIQRKIESNNWSGSDDGNSQKDQSAFWKGMKKKLRV
jgi:hypothetical protein